MTQSEIAQKIQELVENAPSDDGVHIHFDDVQKILCDLAGFLMVENDLLKQSLQRQVKE